MGRGERTFDDQRKLALLSGMERLKFTQCYDAGQGVYGPLTWLLLPCKWRCGTARGHKRAPSNGRLKGDVTTLGFGILNTYEAAQL